MELILYPNPLLNQRSEEVKESDLEAIKILIPGMVSLMNQHQGVGLAAIQAGILKRFSVLDMTKDPYYDPLGPAVLTIINPVVTEKKSPIRLQEGCLSLPLFQEVMDRHSDITVTFRDENWVEHTREFSGLIAQCIEHEIQHMDGQLILEQVSPLVRQMYIKKLKKRRYVHL